MEPLSDSELQAVRCRQLQKRPEDLERVANQVAKSGLQFNAQFEKAHANRIKRYGHLSGSLVLVRNSAVELSQPEPFQTLLSTMSDHILRCIVSFRVRVRETWIKRPKSWAGFLDLLCKSWMGLLDHLQSSLNVHYTLPKI